jgi:proteic killer suppression protein
VGGVTGKKNFTKFVNLIIIVYLCTKITTDIVIEYEKDYLEELYNDGKCTNKKYRFQKQVVTKYQKRIDTLMAATRLEDLFVFNSLNFEALNNGFYSIQIDYHYRLEFKVRQEGSEPIVTICTVTDITNHYQ